jgi:ABC-type iron transport system FetAB ATPase subunit
VSRSIYAFSDEDTYYEAQEKMYKLLMNHPDIMYRDDTINVLTLGYFAFLMVVRSMSGGETQKYLINDYLKTLVRIIKYHETHSVFDEPERANLEFDFTRSD